MLSSEKISLKGLTVSKPTSFAMNLNFWNIHRRCSEVRLGDEKAIIDFSDVTFFTPFALIYVGMFLRHFSSQGQAFELILPNSQGALKYLSRQNFWERFNFDAETINTERLHRFTTSTSFNDIIDIENTDAIAEEVNQKLIGVLVAETRVLSPSTVALIVSELVDNFARHSGKNLAALTLQYYPKQQNLMIAIGDCGMGIRESLSSNPYYRWLKNEPHHRAVIEAFKPGVSRSEGGMGLTEVLDGVMELGGQLRLASGGEYVIVRQGRRAQPGRFSFDMPGVQIELFLPDK